jgi:cell division protein FtsA
MVAALDLGTAKTCVVVGEVDERGIEVCGLGEAPSRGLRKGVIVHVESTVQAIRKAVAEAEAMARCEIRHVTASIGGAHIRGLSSHGWSPSERRGLAERPESRPRRGPRRRVARGPRGAHVLRKSTSSTTRKA